MDREDIKQSLAGYRPELYADADPSLAAALEEAKSDPELAAWLEEEIAFDREFSDLLNSVQPPRGAVDDLLCEVGKRRRRAMPSRRVWLAAAAAIALLAVAGVKYFLFPPAVEFAQVEQVTVDVFRDHMAKFANERFVLDKSFAGLDDSRDWLAGRGFPVYDEVPTQIVKFRGLGCKTIDWNEHKVGLVCFNNDEGQVVHLFVVDAAEFDDLISPPTPLEQLAVVRGLETAGWTTGDKVFLLVGSDTDVKIGGLL